jgi:hypothetical protein
MHLDLTDEEAAALLSLLNRAIDDDRYPLSPRIRTLRAIRAKLPGAPLEPPPARPPTPRAGAALWSAAALGDMLGVDGQFVLWDIAPKKTRLSISGRKSRSGTMNARRSLLIRILVSIEFVSAFTGQASTGYFPNRPKDVALQNFTGVIGDDCGIGNGIGGYSNHWYQPSLVLYRLANGDERQDCRMSPPGLNDQPGYDCVDWPTELVLGKSVVTATCWSDRRFNRGKSTLFCDEIDTRSYWIERHKKHKTG